MLWRLSALLCRSTPEAADVANEFNVPIFKNIEDMLQQKYVPDAAIVCTPNNTRISVSSKLLHAGIYVLVEKPISVDSRSGMELVQIAREAGNVLPCSHLLIQHARRTEKYDQA